MGGSLGPEDCHQWHKVELEGYHISQKKAQMVKQTVIYLGYEGSVRGSHRLSSDRGEFLSFQLGSERFVVAAGAAQVTKRRWEHEEIQAEE
ncbi:hypothetical protein DUI87_23612 [Hirundo rustica rustica]|uniref:MHC class I-like antigen recognition-like domain-containing protein n=1 Tax=Hirundo rustica rustica TaxID=333673 RepID=A0A3M0JG76_HIRRU|nr:hypothetical protein DUI87_23612 [Hirundo rustica rustica]